MNFLTPDFSLQYFEHSAVATFIINPEHRVIFWNKALGELTGCPATDMMGTNRHWQAFYDHERPCLADLVLQGKYEELPKYYTKFRTASLTREAVQAENWFPDIAGKKRYLKFEAAPVYNTDGHLLAAIQTFHDVTDDQLRHEELDKIVNDLQQTLSTSTTLKGFLPICSACSCIRDKEGKWIPAPDYLRKHLGLDFSHGICRGCAQKIYPDLYKKITEIP